QGARGPHSIQERAIDALAAIARRDAADPWIRTAVLSSVPDLSDLLFARLLADAPFVSTRAANELIRELSQIVGVRGQTPEMQRVLVSVGVSEDQASSVFREVVSGIGEGLKRSGKNLRRVEWDAQTGRALDGLLSQAAQ